MLLHKWLTVGSGREKVANVLASDLALSHRGVISVIHAVLATRTCRHALPTAAQAVARDRQVQNTVVVETLALRH